VNDKEDQIIDYKVVYSRRRSIGISVGPDTGVTVRAPYRTSMRTIENMVISKSAWIKKHLTNYKSVVRIKNNIYLSNGSPVLFRGKEYPVRFIESKTYAIRLCDNDIEVRLKNIEKREKAPIMLEKWYRVIAEEIFRKKFEELLIKYKNYNFRPSEFKVRALKRRWGSCTSKGNITISSELVKLDEVYLEYVILHELCHLRHHNHGKEFYKLLSEVFPEWKRRRSELKKYITTTHPHQSDLQAVPS
jgi:predicted metal-dependent hydrolase